MIVQLGNTHIFPICYVVLRNKIELIARAHNQCKRVVYVKVLFFSSFIFFSSCFIDGELEAQWLVSAGFPHLTKAFEEVSYNTIAQPIYTQSSIKPIERPIV